MSERLKYIKTREGEVVIFPEIIEHSTFRNMEPVTAGFCYIHPSKHRVDCFGKSWSLGLESNKKEDTDDATRCVFGLDALLELTHPTQGKEKGANNE